METIRNNVNEIERKLDNMKYEEIPNEFVQFISDNFEAFSYLMSLLEIKKNH